MRKNITNISFVLAILGTVFLISFLVTVYNYYTPIYDNSRTVVSVNNFDCTINGETTEITLPHTFNDLQPKTVVNLETRINPDVCKSIYIKTVYAPMKVYANDNLIHEYGQDGDYPAFLKDPPTASFMINIENMARPLELRIEYTSLEIRDSLFVYPPILGENFQIFKHLFHTSSISFILSLLELMLGFLFMIVGIIVMMFEKKGVAFLWFGLFAVNAGCWSFGDSDLTLMFIHNPTALYFVTFVGLFSMPVPLICFVISMIDFKYKYSVYWNLLIYNVIIFSTIVFQFLGVLTFAQVLIGYCILVPASMLWLLICIIHEAIKYKNKIAKQLIFSMTIFVVSAILEVLNYKLKFLPTSSLVFQAGFLVFIFCTAINLGKYIKNLMLMEMKTKQLEYEVSLKDYLIIEQKKHHHAMIEHSMELRRQRHDLRHHFIMLKQFIAKDQKYKLKEYIDKLNENIPVETEFDYCENIAVNSILSHYINIAQNNGIDIKYNISVPETNPNVKDIDLCVVFGNLIENAIEACCRMSEGEKFVRIVTNLHGEMLYITIDNSFNGEYVKEENNLISSKRNEVGIGTNSVRSIANSHEGDIEFEIDGKVWKTSVYLKL